MSVTVNGTNGLTFNDGSSQNTSPFTGGLGFRNRIINGDFRIDQRNAGASVTPTASGTYLLDRWQAVLSVESKYSAQQNAGSVTPPVGFTNYLGITSLSAYTVGASERFQIRQYIEGFNTADLGWGTANAQAVTLSFWVRSSLTGTFGGVVANSAQNRSYPYTYTISAANTWEQKTVTIAGDTSGTWIGATNGIGLQLAFSLGAGSSVSGTAGAWAGSGLSSATGAVSVVGTNGATFYITGVQLEKGSTATSFDYRPYGTELALCQRYYIAETFTGNTLFWIPASNDNYRYFNAPFKVTMRAAPTVTTVTAGSSGTVVSGGVTSSIFSVYVNFGNSTSYKTMESYTASAEL
jgi:hypothetical protein